MVLVIMLAISALDVAFHRIPNKLLIALFMTTFPALHFNFIALVIAASLILVPSLGAGDVKYFLIGALITPAFNFHLSLGVMVIALSLSLVLWRRNGFIPLAPSISALLIANM